jgi:hypothetical protein
MQTLPYDIIYNIYFIIDDYITANNFWLLSKEFNQNYMTKYTRTYKHKFNILYKDFFTFLSLLPLYNLNSNLHPNFNSDIDFYELVTTKFLSNRDKITISNDIRFLYYLYNNFLTYYLSNNTLAHQLSYVLLSQGPEFINSIIVITFNKNKIRIYPKYIQRNKISQLILQHYTRYNFEWIRSVINLLGQI